MFGLQLDIRLLHQFLEANDGANRLMLILVAQEAHARVIVKELATIGTLTLAKHSFVVYMDVATLVADVLVDIANDVHEYKENPNQALFYNQTARDYEHRISPLWHAFLMTPSFQVMSESNVPLHSIRRTVASVINHVQAKEWMPPLSDEDREAHKRACADLDKEQVDDVPTPAHHKQFGENDPLPLDYWVPSVFRDEQGLQKYRDHIDHVNLYTGPLHQWFYRHYR